MYAKSTRLSAKREVQKTRSAKRAARDENVPAKRANFLNYNCGKNWKNRITHIITSRDYQYIFIYKIICVKLII